MAWLDGEAVGTGILRFPAGSGYLMGSSVRPEARGRGVYRALIGGRLQRLRDRGISYATVVADESTSAPICARLGFAPVCVLKIYST